jgi:hypothetical protein
MLAYKVSDKVSDKHVYPLKTAYTYMLITNLITNLICLS